jgi:cytochrome c peroxidase
MNFRRFVFACLLALLPPARGADVALDFRHFWKERPLVLDAWMERDGGGHLMISRLAYLVSMPVLITADGGRMEQAGWAGFVNAREQVNQLLLAGLPPQDFTALGFSVGLDPVKNAADVNQYPPTHPLNPLVNGLHWSWQGSYIFLAVEGRWRSPEGSETAFSYHLGNDAMRMDVQVPLRWSGGQPVAFAVEFHLDRVFGNRDVVPVEEQGSTHGRDGDELAVLLKRRVEGAFRLQRIPFPPPPAAAPETPEPAIVGTPYRFTMPGTFPMPNLPRDFPMTVERVELGRRLFHEKALSKAGTIHCASCHSDAAFSDARKFSIGHDGRTTPRHGMPLVNLAWKRRFFWDGRAPSLREQALVPIQDEVEMHETLPGVVEKLGAMPEYRRLFALAFGDDEITPARLGIAIEQFVMSLTSFDSRFDRAMRGGEKLTEREQRGFTLFFTEYEPRLGQFGADCFHCHGGAFFTDHGFHNNGLPPRDEDPGLGGVTRRDADRGKFSTPSLRNVAITAPYMHDGRFRTLEEVVDHYAGGIHRSPTLDPNLAKHGGLGIVLTPEDRAALVAFLKTLTDPKFER